MNLSHIFSHCQTKVKSRESFLVHHALDSDILEAVCLHFHCERINFMVHTCTYIYCSLFAIHPEPVWTLPAFFDGNIIHITPTSLPTQIGPINLHNMNWGNSHKTTNDDTKTINKINCLSGQSNEIRHFLPCPRFSYINASENGWRARKCMECVCIQEYEYEQSSTILYEQHFQEYHVYYYFSKTVIHIQSLSSLFLSLRFMVFCSAVCVVYVSGFDIYIMCKGKRNYASMRLCSLFFMMSWNSNCCLALCHEI